VSDADSIDSRPAPPARVGHVDDREIVSPRANDVKLSVVQGEILCDLLHHPVSGIPRSSSLVV